MSDTTRSKAQQALSQTELPSARDTLRILFRHRRKSLALFFGVVMTTLIVSLVIDPVYESQSTLLIKVGRESVSMDPSVLGPTMDLIQDRTNEINSEIGILTSPYLLARVVDAMGIDTYLGADFDADIEASDQTEDAIAHFAERLMVTSDPTSNIIALTFQATDPALARDSLEMLIREYLDRHIEVHSTQASPAFFENRSGELLAQLTLAEDRLERFRTENNIASINVQQQALIEQITGLDTELNGIRAQVNASKARIAALQNSINARPDVTELSRVTGISNPAADNIKTRLVELRFQEADLAARYPDDDRGLSDIRQQITVAVNALSEEEETRAEITTGRDINTDAIRLDVVKERSNLYAGMAQIQLLEREIQLRKANLDDYSRDEIELSRLERMVDIADQEYREYIAHHQRADISAALDSNKVSNVSVIQPASFSRMPVAPRKTLNLMLSILIGIVGGIGIAYLAEYADDSIRTRQDVMRRLQLPVLTTLTAEEYQSCT